MIRIWGASDDMIEVLGHVNEEFGPGTVVEIGSRKDGGVVVRMVYDCDVWDATIGRIGEYVCVPWPVHVDTLDDAGYSVRVSIECPDDTAVTATRDGLVVFRWTPKDGRQSGVEVVKAKARELGLTDAEIAVLRGEE